MWISASRWCSSSELTKHCRSSRNTMRAFSSVLYHSAILSNCPVRSTKWANFAGLTGCVSGAILRTGETSFIGNLPVGSVLVIGLAAVEETFEGGEMVVGGGFALIHRRVGVLP